MLQAVHTIISITSLEDAVLLLIDIEKACKANQKEARRLSYETIHRRVEQGRILDEALSLPGTWGEGVADMLASKAEMHVQTLRDCLAVYRRAGSKTGFNTQWGVWETADSYITWSMVRNWGRKALPENIEKAELHIEKEIIGLERAAVKLEKRAEALKVSALAWTPEKQNEAQGASQRVSEVIGEVRADFNSVQLPKPERVEDERYKAFVRKMLCAWCGGQGGVCHHLDRGGMGTKGSDYYAVSVCQECHQRIHDNPEKTVWEQAGVNPWRVACMSAVLYFRDGR